MTFPTANLSIPYLAIPKTAIPETYAEREGSTATGIERLPLRPSWNWVANLVGVLVTVGIDVGVLVLFVVVVLFVGVLLSVYGNVLRSRYERRMREERATPVADGGRTDD